MKLTGAKQQLDTRERLCCNKLSWFGSAPHYPDGLVSHFQSTLHHHQPHSQLTNFQHSPEDQITNQIGQLHFTQFNSMYLAGDKTIRHEIVGPIIEI